MCHNHLVGWGGGVSQRPGGGSSGSCGCREGEDNDGHRGGGAVPGQPLFRNRRTLEDCAYNEVCLCGCQVGRDGFGDADYSTQTPQPILAPTRVEQASHIWVVQVASPPWLPHPQHPPHTPLLSVSHSESNGGQSRGLAVDRTFRFLCRFLSGNSG